MAIINQSFEISSCDDVELNLKRTSKLEYRISYDDEKENKAIVFIIGGYGANANIYFLDSYREYLAKNFSVVAVNVFYHCFCMRRSDDPKYDTSAVFLQEDLNTLAKVLLEFGLESKDLKASNALSYYSVLNQHLANLKAKGALPVHYQAKLTSSYIPVNSDYQNFGIMATLDHINALKDIVKRFPEFKNLPKIYGGGSYGGYLSLLIAKIAPWYVDGVVDNSGSALPPLNYILGREMQEGDAVINDAHILIKLFIKTHWTRKENSPYFFSKANYLIRALLNPTHLGIQAKKNKNILYVSYHSLKDPLTAAEHKVQMCDILRMLGHDVTLHLIDESKIDGKMIRNLEHGCGISDKALFRKELPLMLEKFQGKSFSMQENSISYPCGNKIFTFKDEGDQVKLEIKENNGTRE